MRIDEILFYRKCWCDLRSFLTDASLDKPCEYYYAKDILQVMLSIERKFDNC